MSIDDTVYDQDPRYAWGSRQVKNEYAKQAAHWLKPLGSWETCATLTFRNDVSQDYAEKVLKKLIRKLNEEVFGKQYTRKVKHSYFSYIYSIELQNRGAIHFHVLFDGPVNRDRIQQLWEQWAGDAKVEITHNVEGSIIYLSKGGDIVPYITKNRHTPAVLPVWW